METTKISAFAKENNIEHMIGEVNNNVSTDWEVFGEYTYIKIGKPLYLKWFSKFDNFAFVIWEEIHSEIKKNGDKNKRFEATLNKLKTMKAMKQDLAMF